MVNWLIGGLLVLALILASRHMIYSNKAGGCPGGCSGCPGAKGHCSCTRAPADGRPS